MRGLKTTKGEYGGDRMPTTGACRLLALLLAFPHAAVLACLPPDVDVCLLAEGGERALALKGWRLGRAQTLCLGEARGSRLERLGGKECAIVSISSCVRALFVG
jgi:hypothetical protein